jgi:hypothetical protein
MLRTRTATQAWDQVQAELVTVLDPGPNKLNSRPCQGFFLRMRRLTSGQNSWKVLLPIRPTNPRRVRTAACCASASLSTRQVFESTLFPASGDVASVSRREIAILTTRYEGHFHDVLHSPAKISFWRSEVARVLSPQGPIPASIAFPVDTPVRRIPYLFPKPSQVPPYSLGLLLAVPNPALKAPAARLWGPIVLCNGATSGVREST